VSVDSGAGATGVKWHNGGIDTSLLNILLQWLIAEGNYNHYCGASYSACLHLRARQKIIIVQRLVICLRGQELKSSAKRM
jgi:hypothetical protein